MTCNKDHLATWVKATLWALTGAMVVLVLYRVATGGDQHIAHVPLSAEQRDSLARVLPAAGMSDTVVRYEAFTVHFNPTRHIANCATYELTDSELAGDARRSATFEQDASVAGCPTPSDYTGSGMDRGHLVPAADLKWSESAMQQSFLLTNVCPMTKALNEGGWAKLEQKVREWVQRDSALLVFAGPVFADGDSTLKTGIAVPSRYFKIVVAPCVRPVRAIAFVYPNGSSGGRLRQYATTIGEVERLTGLQFLTSLPSEERDRLKNAVNLNAWVN